MRSLSRLPLAATLLLIGAVPAFAQGSRHRLPTAPGTTRPAVTGAAPVQARPSGSQRDARHPAQRPGHRPGGAPRGAGPAGPAGPPGHPGRAAGAPRDQLTSTTASLSPRLGRRPPWGRRFFFFRPKRYRIPLHPGTG